jgi:hypothetical protein
MESAAKSWKSDGTEAGTVLVEDLTGDSGGSNPGSIAEAGGKLFVVATSEEFGRELWVADLVPPLLVGDMDVDGVVDMDDIVPFALALNDVAAYEAQFGLPPNTHGDTDGDGDLDFDDIAGFVELLGVTPSATGVRASTAPRAAPLARSSARAAPRNRRGVDPEISQFVFAAESGLAHDVVSFAPDDWLGEHDGACRRARESRQWLLR